MSISVKRVLITGGVRSGKSDYAQRLAARLSPSVLFVATAEAGDEEMARRIAAHRASRPASWRTLEATRDIGALVGETLPQPDVVLVDCITLLVSNVMGGCGEPDPGKAQPAVDSEISRLVKCMETLPAAFVLVTNEVGLGIVPESAAGRLYRDLLGRANQALAARCDEVYLMVAGIPVRIKPPAGP